MKKSTAFILFGAILLLLSGTILLIFRIVSKSPHSSAQSAEPLHLSVATFNAYFLWDGREPEEGFINNPHKNDSVLADRHMDSVSKILRQLNPDIINLVEVENLQTLNYFNRNYLADRGYHAYLVKGIDNATGQDVALLSRYPAESIDRTNEKAASGGEKKGVSKNYYATFNIEGHRIALIGLHFLARPADQSRMHPRQAQARVINELSKKLVSEGYEIIILGDFNDYDPDVPDRNNNRPITGVISICKQLDIDNPEDDLINAASLLPQSQRYTAFWDEDKENDIDTASEFSSIDHMLISKNLFSQVDSVKVLHELNPLTISDHYPLVVYFSFR